MKRTGLFLIVIGLPFFVALAPHDEESSPDAASNAAPAGIGQAGPFASHNIEVLGHLTMAEMGGGQANILGTDCWGWTDPETGKEYALCGMMHATSFIDISDPRNPLYLGRLLTQANITTWRDIKVYSDHAFVVSDNNNGHGMQVFDLTRLRTADPNNPQDFSVDSLYEGISDAHNVAIDEQSGFAYVVGSNRASGGLHAVNIQDPLNPVEAGNFSGDGYTHDAVAITYDGPDSSYTGQEVVFACNIDSLTVVNTTDKSNMFQISRNEYPESGYTHQCWITEDHRYVYVGDEFDEGQQGGPTRVIVFDCLDLDNPVYLGFYSGETNAVDHNLYIKDDKIYLSNYSAGMRVLQIDPNDPLNLTEIGFVDTFMTDDDPDFDGAWSNYPFFESGNIVVNDRQNGMFVVRLAELQFEYPNGRPELIDPDGQAEFLVNVVPGYDGTPMANSGILHVDRGAGFEMFPMSEVSPGLYEATFPTTDCGSVVDYFVSATSTNGVTVNNPAVAPTMSYSAKSADSTTFEFQDDFESDLGWTVSGDATSGFWERAMPFNFGIVFQPASDADGSGFCFLTENAGFADVNGGESVLVSPILDAVGEGDAASAFLNYYSWYFNGTGNVIEFDTFVVEISNDDGQTWHLVETIGPGGNEVSGRWFYKSFNIGDIVMPTNEMRVRFTASDLGDNSLVEAAVDGVEIQLLHCDETKILLGDVNLDGVVDLLDVSPFVALLNDGSFQAEADMNQDGVVSLLDVSLFVDALTE